MISVVCCYNDEIALMNCLEKSLTEQKNVTFERVFVDTRKHSFGSASEALNYGGNLAQGDVLVFVHQDVFFEEPTTLEKISQYCDMLEYGILGVAGLSFQDKKLYTNIVHGTDKKKIGGNLNEPMRCCCLDECLLVVNKENFDKYKFSDLGKTWHLYGTDFVLKMKHMNIESYILPIKIWHMSDGKSFEKSYFNAIKRLSALYKYEKKIWTIYGVWNTNYFLIRIKCLYRKIRLIILNY